LTESCNPSCKENRFSRQKAEKPTAKIAEPGALELTAGSTALALHGNALAAATQLAR